MSSVPISTIYGVFHYKNKAQVDTVCMMLNALGLRLSVAVKDEDVNTEKAAISEEAWLEDLRELPDEKKELAQRLVMFLKE